MPYSKTSQLPPQFANVPEGGRKIALNVINSMLASGATEQQAFAGAWSRVKQKYTKKGGKWVLKTTKESKIAEIAEVFRTLAQQGEAVVAEIGKTFSAQNWRLILQILALIQQLVSSSGQQEPDQDPDADPNAEPNAGNKPKPKPVAATKAQEALKEALAGSIEAIRDEIQQAVDNKNVHGFCSCSTAPDRADYNWSTLAIEGTFADGRVVVSCRKCSNWWLANWTKDDQGKIQFINIKPAAQVVVALEAQRGQEDADIDEAAVALHESAGMDDDGIIKDACLIQPGWGSCGYYSAEMLTREAAKFNGVQMYVDHPTPVEEAQQPERTLKTLAGVVVGPVVFKEGWKGPGLYSPVKVFSDHRAAIKEKASVIGLSAYGGAKAHIGEAEGRTGKIMDSFAKIRSVDFVTVAGAGGALPVIESAREELREKGKPKDLKTATLAELKEARPDLVESIQVEIRESTNKEVKKPMEGNEELTQLKETVKTLETKVTTQETENAKLRESVLLRDAGDEVDLLLREAKIPDITKARVKRECLLSIPVAEAGGLDKAKLTDAVKAKIAEAEAEFAAITKSGSVQTLGGGDQQPANVKEAVGKEMSDLFGTTVKETEKKTE
jgi:cation transport regulator ChaB